MTCQLAQEEKWAAKREQREGDRVDRTRVWKEQRAVEREQNTKKIEQIEHEYAKKRGHDGSMNYY